MAQPLAISLAHYGTPDGTILHTELKLWIVLRDDEEIAELLKDLNSPDTKRTNDKGARKILHLDKFWAWEKWDIEKGRRELDGYLDLRLDSLRNSDYTIRYVWDETSALGKPGKLIDPKGLDPLMVAEQLADISNRKKKRTG